jgi:hypothetical protein
MRFRMALCLAISAVTATAAFAVTDPESGFEVNPPAPFVATVVPNAAANNLPPVVISSSSGVPEPAVGRAVCGVRFRPTPNAGKLTQEQVNQLQARPGIINATKAGLGKLFEIGEPAPFTVNGVAGLEFEGKMTVGPNPGAPSYIATMSTPKGATTLTCSTTPAHYQSAVAQFRTIRDSIKPAR